METDAAVRKLKYRRYFAVSLLVLTLIISIVGSVLLIVYRDYVVQFGRQGYIGLFLITIIADSPIPVPTPSLPLIFTMGGILNPFLVALVAGFGDAIGNTTIYFAGRYGVEFYKSLGITIKRKPGIRPSRTARFLRRIGWQRIKNLARRRVLWAVFILGMYPNPLLFTVVMGMGAARYPFWKFFLVCWAGKMVEASALSFLGYFGLRGILGFFGAG